MGYQHFKKRKMKRRISLVLSLVLFFPVLSLADLHGQVVNVYDGSTLIVSIDRRAEIFGLAGIVCPETEQRFWLEAKDFTSDMVMGKIIRIVPLGTNRHGRNMAIIYLGTKCLNEELLRAGYARRIDQEPQYKQWDKIELDAKLARKGTWLKDNPIQPEHR